jgi:hypothetical protein
VNREAELRAPSRVACTDLLGIVFMASETKNARDDKSTKLAKPPTAKSDTKD